MKLSILCLLSIALQRTQVLARRRLPQEVLMTETITSDLQLRSLQQQSSSSSTSSSTSRRADELPDALDHLVTDLPYLSPDSFPTEHYAGHIPASHDDDKKLFYWLFLPDTSNLKNPHSSKNVNMFPDGDKFLNDEDIPLLIWLNGGPGCSSMDGLWLENGPFRLVSPQTSGSNDWRIEINPHSWHKSPAYVLYIDQPVGTGLSFTKHGKYCKNDLEINIDFHLFLENFMKVHKDLFLKDQPVMNGSVEQWVMKRPLYFSGESHAGHYIPSMMDYILERNDDLNSDTMTRVLFDLQGAAIGNGWTDPYYQYSASDISYGRAIIDLAQKEALDIKEMECRKHLEKRQYASRVCFGLLDSIISDSAGATSRSKLSVYDNRLWELKGAAREFPKGHKDVERYLGGWTGSAYPRDMKVDYQQVLKAIHAEESVVAKQRYQECTDPPYNALSGFDGLGVRDEVVRILHHNMKPRLLFFNGVNDMICNHVGNENYLDHLPWNSRKDWVLQKRFAWSPIPEMTAPAGFMKQYDNLSFLKVMNSGHMVPMDVPDIALAMMQSFMFPSLTASFESGGQALTRSDPTLTTTQECVCHETHCDECPVCPKQSIPSVLDEINDKSDDDDNEEEFEDTSRFARMVQSEEFHGGWIGAIMGVSLTLTLVVIRDRRRAFEASNISGDDLTALRQPDAEVI